MRSFEVISEYLDSDIKLPKRSTAHSAGYDFFAPKDIVIEPSSTPWVHHAIPTGIKAKMEEDDVLQLYLRSSAPEKLNLMMTNAVGIIDADYYNNSDNEGHIHFLVYYFGTETLHIKKGEKIGQGVFTRFLKVEDDDVTEIRSGGFGSTGK